jgi:glycosyltransferase involved in cell wall biosynthesis
VPPLKHNWVKHWQAEVRRRILDHAAAAVTTSDSAAEIFRGVYGDALPPLHVIEHGRDLKQRNFAKAPSPDEATRVLVLGNLTLPKGGDFLRKVIAFDREGRFEFHILGDAWPEYRNLGVWHGPYERDRLDEKVASIRPSLVGLFSIWGETYCHTLSEAWALGIPVVATNLGALAERIRRHGGGWLVDAYDPAAAYDVLCRIVDNPDEYQRQKARATIGNLRTVEAMADDYDALYRETLGSHRCINFTESLPVAPALAAG